MASDSLLGLPSADEVGDQSKSTGEGGGAMVSLKSMLGIWMVRNGDDFLNAAAMASEERERDMLVGAGEVEEVIVIDWIWLLRFGGVGILLFEKGKRDGN